MTNPNFYQQNVYQQEVQRSLNAGRQAAEEGRRLAKLRRTNRVPAAKSYPRRANGTLWDQFVQFLRDL